jgi:hypothetical protein
LSSTIKVLASGAPLGISLKMTVVFCVGDMVVVVCYEWTNMDV